MQNEQKNDLIDLFFGIGVASYKSIRPFTYIQFQRNDT